MVYQKTKHVLREQKLAPSKKLGQNFLVHRHTAERIAHAAGAGPDDTVIEVGVGLGALTRPLAASVGRVIGIEADSGLVKLHQAENDLPANVELIHQDILKTDFVELRERVGGRLKIVANLPYSISSPFIFKLIEHSSLMDWAVVMLQKEVAMRLAASPGTKNYGAPSVLLAARGTATTLFNVKPSEFHPQPKVDSTVIRLAFHPLPERVTRAGEFDWPLFRKIVNAGFGQRRKTLLNSLAGAGLAPDKTILAAIIRECGIEPTTRAEKLEFEHFVQLARCFRAHAAQT